MSTTISEIRKRDGDTSNTITVEQIENGFLITKNKEWKDKKSEWHYECKKYYSEKNPLEDASKELAAYFD
jgi:hypothetical protein